MKQRIKIKQYKKELSKYSDFTIKSFKYDLTHTVTDRTTLKIWRKYFQDLEALYKILKKKKLHVIKSLIKDENEHNRFTMDMVITDVTHVDADEEKNIAEHAVIRGCVFDFRNAILPVEFLVKNTQGIKYFENLDASSSNPIYTKVWGRINCSSVNYEERTESAFGEAVVNTRTRRTREWEITGAAEEPFNFGDEGVLTVEELTKAMQDRQVHLADIKKRADDYAASKATPAAAAAPVDTKPVMPKGSFKF